LWWYSTPLSQPQQHRQHHEPHQGLAIAQLGGAHRQRHSEAAADEDRRVDAAQPDVQVMAAGDEHRREERPVDHIGGEHPAEEHDLGDQEDPHPERSGFALLIEALEMMRQERMRLRRHAAPPPACSRTLRG
jgi:hypothetical protein